MAQTYTFSSDDAFLINPTPGATSADGLLLSFTVTGTNSAVLKVNTAPPGAARSLTNVAWLNEALALQSAGTAITATGLAYVSNADAMRGDLYLDLDWTSGTVVVTVAPSSLGGGGSSGGTVPAADVTAGTFGANTGSTGDYAFPAAATVGTTLTAADVVSTDDVQGVNLIATTDATTPLLTVTGGASNVTAATITPGSVTAANTTAGVLINPTWNTSGVVTGALRVVVTDTASGANSLVLALLGGAAGTTALFSVDKDGDGLVAGTLGVTGVLSNSATTATLAQSATTATVSTGTGTGSGNSTNLVRGAAGTTRAFVVTTGATTFRWSIGANSTAESGSNAGSNLLVSAYDDAGAAIDDPLAIVRAAAGAIITAAGRPFSIGGAPGAAATVTRSRIATTAIPNNTATTIATITIPNAAHSCAILFRVVGSLGAGGAIGANEASASNSYVVTVTRTAGVNVVGAISAAFGAAAAAVAGADTVTSVLTLGAVAGAVGATNTIPVQVTVARGGGASDNHTSLLTWEVLNANASGVGVA